MQEPLFGYFSLRMFKERSTFLDRASQKHKIIYKSYLNILNSIPRTSCFHIFCLGRNVCLILPGVFSPPEGVLAQVILISYDILLVCCDVMPRSQQFHEFWFEAACFFKLNVFQHHKKLNLSFLENQWYGVSHPIRANSRLRLFNKMSYSARAMFFAMHTGSCCRLYQPDFTPFDTLKLQHLFMLPKSAKSA